MVTKLPQGWKIESSSKDDIMYVHSDGSEINAFTQNNGHTWMIDWHIFGSGTETTSYRSKVKAIQDALNFMRTYKSRDSNFGGVF